MRSDRKQIKRGEKIMSVNCVVINRDRNIADVFDEVEADIVDIYRCFVCK